MITFAAIMEWIFTALVFVMLVYVIARYLGWGDKHIAPRVEKMAKKFHKPRQTTVAPQGPPVGNLYDPQTDADWQWTKDGVYEPFWEEVS